MTHPNVTTLALRVNLQGEAFDSEYRDLPDTRWREELHRVVARAAANMLEVGQHEGVVLDSYGEVCLEWKLT